MSFESGRKLGLTASLIYVIVPVITVILYVFFFLSLFGIFSSAVAGKSPTFGSLSLLGITMGLIALGITSLIGIILFIIAMYRLSQYYNEPRIYKNTLYGFLVNVIGAAVLIAVLFALILTTTVSSATNVTHPVSAAGFIGWFLGVLAAVLVIVVVSAVLYKRAFNKLGEKSGENSFSTAGTLYLIGSILTIILVGSLILWIAWVFALSGFYSLKPKTVEPSTIPYSALQPPATYIQGQKKRCSYCGAENYPDSVYCANCGKQLQ